MKRRDLVNRIKRRADVLDIAWAVEREGANHTVYRLGATRIPIPRHREIGERLAEDIFKETEPELGPRWWR